MESAEGKVYRIANLKTKTDTLYRTGNPEGAADWAEYMLSSHVFAVANKAGEIAERFGANKELATAAGMLHDVADAVLKRQDPRHGDESKSIARKFLSEFGFTDDEIRIVVDDAIEYHSCRGNDAPQTPEGKAMATADAVVHLQSDFYEFAVDIFTKRGESAAEIKKWGLEKIDRDFNKKIFFPEVKNEVRADFERLKARFESL